MDDCRRAIQNVIYSTKALGRSSLFQERQSQDQEQKNKVEQMEREDGSNHNGTQAIPLESGHSNQAIPIIRI